MKKSVVGFSLALILLNFVSAANFGLGDMLDNLDSESVILITIFLLVFVLCFWATSRIFVRKDGFGTKRPIKPIAATISIAIAFFAMYGVNKSGFSFGGLGLEFRLFDSFLGILFPILILFGFLYLLFKLKLYILPILGVILIIISQTDVIYESEQAMWWGIILIILFLLIKLVSFIKKVLKGRRGAGFTGNVRPKSSKFWKHVGKGAGKGLEHMGKGVGAGFKGLGKGAAWGGKAAWKNAHKKQLEYQDKKREKELKLQQEEAEKQRRQMEEDARKRQKQQEEQQRQMKEKEENTLNKETEYLENLRRNWEKDAHKITKQIENSQTGKELQVIDNQTRALIKKYHPNRYHSFGKQTEQFASQITSYLNQLRGSIENRKKQMLQIENQRQNQLLLEDKYSKRLEQAQKYYRTAEKIARNKTIAADQAAANVKNAQLRYQKAMQENKGVHKAKRSYERMVQEVKKAEDEYQKAQIDLSKARDNLQNLSN